MTVQLIYRGQLALAAGVSEEELEVAAGATVGSVLKAASGRHGPEFAKFVYGEDGALRSTLLVAIDGEQAEGEDAPVPESAREITLIPPIAGG